MTGRDALGSAWLATSAAKVDVGTPDLLPVELAHVVRGEEEAPRQFGLEAEVEGVDYRNLQVRIDAAAADRSGQRHGGAAGIRKIAALILAGEGVGRQVELREDQVALGAIVEGTEAAAEGELPVTERIPREAETRHGEHLRVI